MPLNARNFTNFTFPINILSYFFLQLLMSLTRCIGQGNFNSKFNHDGTSIVKRFASRSLTGRGLQIKIHQHIGYRLHLLWDPTNDETARSMCIERVFLMYHEVFVVCVPLLVGVIHQNNVGICTFRALRGLYKTFNFICVCMESGCFKSECGETDMRG